MKRPPVDMTASRRNGAPYVGVTSSLPRHAAERRCGTGAGFMVPCLKTLSVLALGLAIAGCVTTQETPYGPNVVPIDTTGNFGAR
jgi:hypothetical protein